jgi:hypothetical protein
MTLRCLDEVTDRAKQVERFDDARRTVERAKPVNELKSEIARGYTGD